MDAQNHCASCVYFDDHASNGASAASGGQTGLCRYNPPVSQPDANARGLWPVVTGEDWCGHYLAPHARGGQSQGRGAQISAQ